MKKKFLAALLLGFMTSTSFAIDPGKVKGTLLVGGQKVELKYCYAHQYDNEEGMLDGPELRILMTDRKVPQTLLSGFDGPMKIESLVREDKLRGVLVKLDAKKPSGDMYGTVLFKPADPRASLIFFTSSGGDKIKDLQIGQNRVQGKVEYKLEQGFFEDIPSFEFNASFSAPLFHDEPVTEKLTGFKAAQSAPAQALVSYYKAEYPRIGRQISKVFIRGTRAVVIIQEKDGKSAQGMIQADGVWKVD